jgi:glycosyltransferase involved in cell wall biosynthesis
MKFATLLIPTAPGRNNLLKYTLNALKAQNYKNFEVLLVSKTKDVELTNIIRGYSEHFDISILFQRCNGLMEAYNEGIRNAYGDVILFLDDDAVPNPDCVEEHLLTYDRLKVSGVSGEVIPSYLMSGVPNALEGSSEIVTFYSEPEILRVIGDALWNCPLAGQEQFLAYISKAGYSKKNIYSMRRGITNSLLCMAANMSVLSSALKDFRIPTSFLRRGIAFEQVIAWHLWKNGHRMVFNPRAKVHHILHGQTMSRLLDTTTICKATIEKELIFYYLLQMKEKISFKHRMVSLSYNYLVHLKKFDDNWKRELAVMKGMFFGNILGLAWFVSQKTGGVFMPIQHSKLK